MMVMCLTLPIPYYICYLLWLYLSFRSMGYSDIIELAKSVNKILYAMKGECCIFQSENYNEWVLP